MAAGRAVWVIPLIFLFIVFFYVATDTTGEEAGQKGRDETSYTIKKGDTLWGISKEHLKDPLKWQEIWSRNPDIRNPDIIHQGYRLVIPPLATSLTEADVAGVLPPAETTVPTAPDEGVVLPPAEATMPVPPAEGTLPLPSVEATIPIPAVEGTVPLAAIEVTIPVLPKEEILILPPPPGRREEYLGADKCRGCHEDLYAQWADTIHAKWRPSFIPSEKDEEAGISCETCHGPGSLHLKDNEERHFLITFGPSSKNTKEEQNAVCLKCHEHGGLYYWKGGSHGSTLRCVDCHYVMDNLSVRNLLNIPSEKEGCLQCHTGKKGKLFRSPHLSQADSKMTCSSCHDPHGSDAPALLAATSINENCFKCHADKRGPYLFDHLPVQENCLLCHDPHASMHRPLLKVRQPFLCLECHTNISSPSPATPDRHDILGASEPGRSRFTYNRGCTNCHPMIHGSRHPSGARLQR